MLRISGDKKAGGDKFAPAALIRFAHQSESAGAHLIKNRKATESFILPYGLVNTNKIKIFASP
jgi:hypothetical protein